MGQSLITRLIVPLSVAAALVIAGWLYVDYRLTRARILSDLQGRAESAVAAGFSAVTALGPDRRRAIVDAARAGRALPDSDALQAYVELLRIDNAGFGFMLTPQGTMIAAPSGPLAAMRLADILPLAGTGESWPDRLEAWDSGPLHLAVECPRSDDICQLQLRRESGRGWAAATLYSETEALRVLRAYETRVAVVGMAMLLQLALAAVLIARRLMAPLRDLALASAAVARGDLEVELPSARSDDEVGQLLRAFDSMRRALGSHMEQIRVEAAMRSRLDGELNAAREIQMAMLPQSGEALVNGEYIDLWARVRPARAVGGDLYSFHRYTDSLLFCIGDVSDKGVPAALFMTRAISLIQQWEVQPARVPPNVAMRQLNDALCRDNERCMFLTLSLCLIDKATLELQYSSGGHSAPLLLRDGHATPLAQHSGAALGLEPDLDYPLNRIQLRRGDRLLLRTDGFDEARNDRDEMLGEERLRDVLDHCEPETCAECGEAVFAAVDSFTGDAPQSDDMALLLLEVHGQRSEPLQEADGGFPLGRHLITEGLDWLQTQWRILGLPETVLPDIQLVLEEILCNVRDHARPRNGAAVGLRLQRYRDRLELECADPGKPCNPLEGRRALLGQSTGDAQVGGLGLHLICKLTDAQFYRREDGRNILRVRRRLDVVTNAIGESR